MRKQAQREEETHPQLHISKWQGLDPASASTLPTALLACSSLTVNIKPFAPWLAPVAASDLPGRPHPHRASQPELSELPPLLSPLWPRFPCHPTQGLLTSREGVLQGTPTWSSSPYPVACLASLVLCHLPNHPTGCGLCPAYTEWARGSEQASRLLRPRELVAELGFKLRSLFGHVTLWPPFPAVALPGGALVASADSAPRPHKNDNPTLEAFHIILS